MSIPTIREIEESEEWLEDIEEIIKNSDQSGVGDRIETQERVWIKIDELRRVDLKTVRSLRTLRAIIKEKKCSV